MSPEYVTSVEYAADRARWDAHIERVDRLVDRLQILLEEQSGERERMARMERDIDRSHAKHRAHEADHRDLGERLDRIESRQGRIWWGMVGALALLEAVIRATPLMERLIR